MTVLEKFEYLIKMRGLTERQFLMQNHVHFGLVKRIRNGYEPQISDIKKMCRVFDFDPSDFLDSTSSIKEELLKGEHHIKMMTPKKDESCSVSEDYPHEDNSRYEEKD